MTLTPEQIAKLRQDLADAETALDTPPAPAGIHVPDSGAVATSTPPEAVAAASTQQWSNGTGSGVNHYSTP